MVYRTGNRVIITRMVFQDSLWKKIMRSLDLGIISSFYKDQEAKQEIIYLRFND